MKILLINNHTQHLSFLKKELAGHQVEMQMYRPGIKFRTQGKDLVILSGGGGEGLEIHDLYEKGKTWYDDQINFVRETAVPVLGICMGFEVICKAYGQQVKPMPKLLEQYVDIQTTSHGRQLFGHPELRQYEAHQWNVPKLEGEELVVLGHSKNEVQIIKHRSRKLLATQFHPEKGGTLCLNQLLSLAV